MRRLLVFVGVVGAFVLVAALIASAVTPRVREPMRVHVVEHAATDTVIDTDASGTDTTGDLLTFHNPVFNAADTQRVGHDQGDCIRIDPAAGTWECRWVTWVPGGTLMVEGPFRDTRDTSLAITGGTGLYRNARGSMLLQARNGGTEYDFIFSVLP